MHLFFCIWSSPYPVIRMVIHLVICLVIRPVIHCPIIRCLVNRLVIHLVIFLNFNLQSDVVEFVIGVVVVVVVVVMELGILDINGQQLISRVRKKCPTSSEGSLKKQFCHCVSQLKI